MKKLKKFGKWNVRVILKGDKFGLDDCLTHEKNEPTVEFYDTTHMHTDRGQFVSRYYLSTLIERDGNYGLDLQGDVPSWKVSAETMTVIAQWLIAHKLNLAIEDK